MLRRTGNVRTCFWLSSFPWSLTLLRVGRRGTQEWCTSRPAYVIRALKPVQPHQALNNDGQQHQPTWSWLWSLVSHIKFKKYSSPLSSNNTSLRDHGSEECSATSSSRNILHQYHQTTPAYVIMALKPVQPHQSSSRNILHYHQTTPAYVIMALKPVQPHQVQEIFFTTYRICAYVSSYC